ncbi:MAG TPA: hypothetical protein VL688_07180 [Verrucomicrobiae bacterium]|jgi:hypothetical protein|nr:hypothetical protein [Verrucomicrobiae bacterium]
MKNSFRVFAVGLLLPFLCSCAHGGQGRAYDAVLRVTPIRVKPIEKGASIDAIEQKLENEGWPTAVVVFRVDKVVSGEFNKVKVRNASRWDQAREAGKNKNILKILTLDFDKPEEIQDQEWISVAVTNPIESFGIHSWEQPEKKSGRIYLKRVPEQPGTFVMVKYRG